MRLDDLCPVTTAAALARAATVAPEVEALVAGADRVTFAQLDQRVGEVRRALLAAGIDRGDHVAVCMGNGLDWVTLFHAIGSLGAVTVPINTRFRADELRYALAQSRARLLFVTDRFLRVDFIAMLREIAPGIDTALPAGELPDLSQIVVLGDDVPAAATPWTAFLAAAVDDDPGPSCWPDDVLLIQFTSGTTAYPKGVLLTHRSMCANGYLSGLRLGLRLADRYHSVRPFFHVAGTTLSILLALQHAATLVTMERFVAPEALALMETERCTHFSANDTIALMLLDEPSRSERRLSLRGAWLAASSTVVRRVIDEMGAREAVTGYGLSEASPNICQSAWWEPEEIRVATRMRPQPGLEVEIRDPQTGAPLPADQVGEIHVRGWTVMRGYYDMPEQTAEAIDADGWLRTGDLGSLGADQRLSFVGRAKEMLRVGGENVAPTEVEDILQRHPAIQQATVVGVADARLVEVPFAFVIPVEDARPTESELLAWARDHMAGFKVPRHFEVVESFEHIGMTASSKVQKRHAATAAERVLAARREAGGGSGLA